MQNIRTIVNTTKRKQRNITSMKYPYIRISNKHTIPSISKTSYLPHIQSTNEKKKYKGYNLEKNSQYMPGKKKLMLKIPTTYYLSNTSPLQRSNEFDHADLLNTTDIFSKKHQLSKVSTGLKKKVDNSQANSNYSINITEQYSRHNDNYIDPDSIDAMIIANASIKNISHEKCLHYGKVPNSTTKNSTIGFDCKVTKEKTSQAISQELLDSSSEAAVFVDDLPIKDHHNELQKEGYLSPNFNIQSNPFFGKSGYTNDSETISYRTKSTTITNITSCESNTVLNSYTSNEKGLINIDNVRSNKNLAIITKVIYSLLCSNNRKNNSLVRKTTSETMAKIITDFHTRKNNPILLVHKVIAQRHYIYANQVIISNTTLYSEDIILHDTMINEVTVSNNSEVALFNTARHRRTINLQLKVYQEQLTCLVIR